jgi:predicted transglutaminase-like cysteine proteinase
MTATAQQLAQLRAINNRVNAIPYQGLGVDQAADNWIDAPATGEVWECRDYTVAKAKALREAGWPVADMFVVLCWIEAEPPAPGRAPVRQYHAVLGCRAGGDIYILDNRTPDIYDWRSPPFPYLWAHQQIPGTVEFRDASGAAGLV